MYLLIAAIVFALLVTMGLPILVGIWFNKYLAVSWRVMTYGILGYFIVQALVTLLFSGILVLSDRVGLNLTEQSFFVTQLVISIFLGAVLGVVIRWAAMRYIKEPLINLEAAYGIGIGYGGTESIIRVGLPLLFTFITMLSHINIDPQTSTLDPEMIVQLEALWQVPVFVPLVGSLERLAAFVMHLTVTILILKAFTRNNHLWLGAAIGLELMTTGLVVGLAEAGLAYGWVVGLAVLLMVANFYLLYLLNGFDFDITKANVEG